MGVFEAYARAKQFVFKNASKRSVVSTSSFLSVDD
jgi:hypothetical protein